MASPTSMAMRVGERRVYPFRDSFLIYNLRRRRRKLSGRVETWELLVNCLVDREGFAEKTEAGLKNLFMDHTAGKSEHNESLLRPSLLMTESETCFDLFKHGLENWFVCNWFLKNA